MSFIGVLKTEPGHDEIMARIMADLDTEQRQRQVAQEEAQKPSTRGARLREATTEERTGLDEQLQAKLKQLQETKARMDAVGEDW